MTDPTPTPPALPALVTIPGVPLVDVGTWAISTGEWSPTTADLHAAVAALDCPAVRRPVLKIGHTDDRFTPGDGEPALGWVDNLTVSADGQRLTGDYTAVPAWLGTRQDDGHSVLASAYPDRSVEGEYRHACQLGHEHPFVLTGVALLGVTPPGVGTLGSLHDLASMYGVAAAADPDRSGVVIARVTFKPPVAAAAGHTTHQNGGPGMPLELTEAQISLREKLGLPEDADGDAITAAAIAALTNPTPAAVETATPTVVEVEKPLPAGMQLVDEGTLNELKVAAAAGVAAKERQDTDDRKRTVAAAVADGRIPPARVGHWEQALKADPEGMGAHLANMPKGLIPVAAKGHDTAPEGAVAASAADDTAWVVSSSTSRVEA